MLRTVMTLLLMAVLALLLGSLVATATNFDNTKPLVIIGVGPPQFMSQPSTINLKVTDTWVVCPNVSVAYLKFDDLCVIASNNIGYIDTRRHEVRYLFGYSMLA